MILADLLPDVLGRIEENVEAGPIFWNLQGEVYPEMVYGMFEAALVAGVVQLSSIAVTLTPGNTYFNIQSGGGGYGSGGFGDGGYGGNLVPTGVLAPLRMRAPYPIRKSTLKGLDDMIPNWQQADPAPQIRSWFPLGVSMFGIYPQVEDDTQVVMDFIVSPVTKARPYDGTETIPFQSEFADAFSKYGAALLRAKEGGAEAEEAETVYKAYLADIKSLSVFQGRLDNLVFSAAYGGRTQVNPRTQV